MTLQIKSLEEYKAAYQYSVEAPESFWAEQASTFFWRRKWHTVLKNDFISPDVQWFVGGKLNITENCIDRHLNTKADKTAFLFEPNDKITRDEVKGVIDSFCNDLVAKRALYDYLVVCDESNNTPDRIDRNELYIDIAIEPVKAIEEPVKPTFTS